MNLKNWGKNRVSEVEPTSKIQWESNLNKRL